MSGLRPVLGAKSNMIRWPDGAHDGRNANVVPGVVNLSWVRLLPSGATENRSARKGPVLLPACETNTMRDPSGDQSFSSTIRSYDSWAFTRRALDSGLVPSMGSIGDCFDNAVVESFWGRMQVELLNRRRWKTRVELANAIFECLEIFHNRKRRHSALGMLTPTEFEKMHTYPSAVA